MQFKQKQNIEGYQIKCFILCYLYQVWKWNVPTGIQSKYKLISYIMYYIMCKMTTSAKNGSIHAVTIILVDFTDFTIFFITRILMLVGSFFHKFGGIVTLILISNLVQFPRARAMFQKRFFMLIVFFSKFEAFWRAWHIY